jgi:hypothetical protein
MRLPNANKLLVEGDEDKRVIPQLIEANGIRWGERRDEWPVEIEAVGGIDELLRPGSIRAELGQRNLQRLGILLDADDQPAERWQRLRAECAALSLDLPATPPPEGAIVRSQEGKSLGIWLMPDNQSRGMLETFLAYLCPTGTLPCGRTFRKSLPRRISVERRTGTPIATRPRSTHGWPGRIRLALSSTTPCSRRCSTRAPRTHSRS